MSSTSAVGSPRSVRISTYDTSEYAWDRQDVFPLRAISFLLTLKPKDSISKNIWGEIKDWLNINREVLVCHALPYLIRRGTPSDKTPPSFLQLFHKVKKTKEVKKFPCVRNVYVAAVRHLQEYLQEIYDCKKMFDDDVRMHFGQSTYSVKIDVEGIEEQKTLEDLKYITTDSPTFKDSNHARIYWRVANVASLCGLHFSSRDKHDLDILIKKFHPHVSNDDEKARKKRDFYKLLKTKDKKGDTDKLLKTMDEKSSLIEHCPQLVAYLLPLSSVSEVIRNFILKSKRNIICNRQREFSFSEPLQYWNARFLFHFDDKDDDKDMLSKRTGRALDTVTGSVYIIEYHATGEFQLIDLAEEENIVNFRMLTRKMKLYPFRLDEEWFVYAEGYKLNARKRCSKKKVVREVRCK